jgi:hypothetical protein
MSQRVREEMLLRLRQRYLGRGRQGRSKMLDELCEQFGYSREKATELLGAKAGWGGDPAKRKGRPPVYGPEVALVFERICKASEQPCGKRLAQMREIWLPSCKEHYSKLNVGLKAKVMAISPAQIDRLLAPLKAGLKASGRCGTKPNQPFSLASFLLQPRLRWAFVAVSIRSCIRSRTDPLFALIRRGGGGW